MAPAPVVPIFGERLASTAEVAEHLHVCERTVRRLRERHRDPLPVKRIGRKCLHVPSEVEAWVIRQGGGEAA